MSWGGRSRHAAAHHQKQIHARAPSHHHAKKKVVAGHHRKRKTHKIHQVGMLRSRATQTVITQLGH